MDNTNYIQIINQFIDHIEELNFEITINKSNFTYPINNFEHFKYSKLYFIQYKSHSIMLILLDLDLKKKKLIIQPIDYKNVIWKLDYENTQLDYLSQIDNFISDIKLFSTRIITYNSIIKKKYRFYDIYPYMNKIYLKNFWKDKYCMCLISIDKFSITLNDEKEDFEEFDSYELFKKSEKLKIFFKNIFF